MEIFLDSRLSLSEVKNEILSLRLSEEPLIIRGGKKFLNASEWKSFLLADCGLKHDRSHYNFSEKLELADWWEISFQPDKATSYAYSNTKQPFHTDNAWFSQPAELNFFIMEKQAASGGEQMFYQVSRLFQDLASEEPALFKDLTTTKVVISKGDGGYFNETTILKDSNSPQVFWNFYRTDKSHQDIMRMCNAFFEFLERKERTRSVELVKCETDDCFVFNDTRMLHARNSFEATLPFDRILIQSMWHFPS
ncbi:TauD/TfdA family dioxygenase [Polaromonas sp. YR568]|uniref:TauD/TfdA family dioxygenase n=1 Tax=Polaromonas sp. YR568 TaxID=1855301 RepID=UPI003137BF9A